MTYSSGVLPSFLCDLFLLNIASSSGVLPSFLDALVPLNMTYSSGVQSSFLGDLVPLNMTYSSGVQSSFLGDLVPLNMTYSSCVLPSFLVDLWVPFSLLHLQHPEFSFGRYLIALPVLNCYLEVPYGVLIASGGYPSAVFLFSFHCHPTQLGHQCNLALHHALSSVCQFQLDLSQEREECC